MKLKNGYFVFFCENEGVNVKALRYEDTLFVWSGGMYVDVLIRTSSPVVASRMIAGEWYFYTDRCINMGHGANRTPFKRKPFIKEIKKHLKGE